MRFLLALLLALSTTSAFAQQQVNVRFTWTPLPGGHPQRIMVREQADGAWYYPVGNWVNLPAATNSYETTVSNRYWVFLHIQTLSSGSTGPTTLSNFLVRHPDILHETDRINGVTNLTKTLLGIVPDPSYVPDSISLADSSMIDGRIIFKTELSKYRPGTDDVYLVRPPKNVYEVQDPTKANNKLEHIDIRNDGTKPVTIISGTAVNAQYVSVNPSTSPAQPAVIQPGATQRFQLWYWPLLYSQNQHDFEPDLSQPIDQFTPQAIFVTKDVTQIIVPLEGHSTFDADINYDGKVNLGDLGLLRANYLKNTSSPGWDPTSDINQDGVINLGDYGLLRAQFGKERN